LDVGDGEARIALVIPTRGCKIPPLDEVVVVVSGVGVLTASTGVGGVLVVVPDVNVPDD
jgi:hypothetical protein